MWFVPAPRPIKITSLGGPGFAFLSSFPPPVSPLLVFYYSIQEKAKPVDEAIIKLLDSAFVVLT